jgi:glutamate formiminotransferase
VPNVSEGRDLDVVNRLVEAARAEGARLADVHADPDHHRAVFTLLGVPEAVERSALALARAAVALVDLRRHAGVHPRVGAVDVIPFVPLRGASMREAVGAAHRVGRALAAQCAVPVLFYGAAALRPDRRDLPALRRGGLAALAGRLAAPDGGPDAGPPAPHPRAGVALVGARGPLIAFNALLDAADLEVARAIARVVREASGGLPAVRALGVWLASRGRAQVSLNLLDFRRTPPRVAAERVEEEARRRGATVRAWELVGCAPAPLFAAWPAALAPVADLTPAQLLDPALFAPVS